MMRVVVAILLILSTIGCSKNAKVPLAPLNAPGGTAPVVAQQIEQGNRDFAAQNWTGAKIAYLTALERDPELAEAHYNLALSLERLGDQVEARKHYVKAANLAPGNKVIWNAPPLRKFDGDAELDKKSFMDPKPR